MASKRGPRPSPYITPEGERRFHEELAFLWQVERPRVTQGVAEAAAEGDRSENAEYIYGKKRLREIDRRIRYLSKRLDELEVVVREGATEEERIFFGAYVRVEDEDGTQHMHRIVGPDETDMDPCYVSLDAPLAKALLRRSEGDEVTIRTPRGERMVEVVEVTYERFDELPPPPSDTASRRWGG